MARSFAEAFSPQHLQTVLLSGVETEAASGPTAAVAAILRDGDHGPETLFIERSRHEHDPWSGHMAFPGGRCEPSDRNSFSTAARETAEEIGVEIAGIQKLGRLDDVQGNQRRPGTNLRVTPHVCWWVGERPALQLNYEVADAFWVSLADLADLERFIDYTHPNYPAQSWPGIRLDGGQVVWGLTLRMLQDLFSRAWKPLLEAS